jgi:Type ISP C-terminal specificity domain
MNAHTPIPELAKHLRAIKESNRQDREWMADEWLEEIMFLLDVVGKGTLETRWERLVTEKNAERREELFHPHEGGDKTSTKASKVGLTGHEFRSYSIASDRATAILPVRYAFRTFDWQWIIPDNRLINRPNPSL